MTKTVLITGASRGIGKSIATQFAKEGCNLIITCKDSEDSLKRLARELMNSFHIKCTCFIGDMGNCENVDLLFKEIENIDVLINNAGVSHVGLLSDMTDAEWACILNTNLSSVFYLCRQSIPLMLKKKSGRIINISSEWGNVGASMEVAYSATKGGLNAFTKALAKELAPSNIQVNAIACGVIDTSMNACFSKEEREALIAEIPADRMGTPEEVAALAWQLANSPSYLTGQIIALDGGWI